MARCGCFGGCNCVVTAGEGVTVTGFGSQGSPYVVSAPGGGGAGALARLGEEWVSLGWELTLDGDYSFGSGFYTPVNAGVGVTFSVDSGGLMPTDVETDPVDGTVTFLTGGVYCVRFESNLLNCGSTSSLGNDAVVVVSGSATIPAYTVPPNGGVVSFTNGGSTVTRWFDAGDAFNVLCQAGNVEVTTCSAEMVGNFQVAMDIQKIGIV